MTGGSCTGSCISKLQRAEVKALHHTVTSSLEEEEEMKERRESTNIERPRLKRQALSGKHRRHLPIKWQSGGTSTNNLASIDKLFNRLKKPNKMVTSESL